MIRVPTMMSGNGEASWLENVIERAVLVSAGGVMHAHDLPPTLQTAEVSGTLPRVSLDHAVASLEVVEQ